MNVYCGRAMWIVGLYFNNRLRAVRINNGGRILLITRHVAVHRLQGDAAGAGEAVED